MIHAIHYMSISSKVHRYRFNSKIYEILKPQISKTISKAVKESWQNGSRDDQIKWMKENTPFKNKEIHKKTINNREKNGNNIWSTNNPMWDPIKAKKIASKRSGDNHWLRKSRSYYYKNIDDQEWIKINTDNGLQEALNSLGFSYSTFMKMISEDYKPKRGPLSNINVKRVIK